MQRENIFGGHFLGSCVCNHTFTKYTLPMARDNKKMEKPTQLECKKTLNPYAQRRRYSRYFYPQEGKRDIVAFHCCVISGWVHSLILLVKTALMTLSNCPWVSPPTKTYLLRIEYCVFYIRIQIHQHYCYAQNLSNHLFPRAL